MSIPAFDAVFPARLRKAFLCALPAFIFLAALRCFSIPSGCELEQDCFYHARVADFGPSVYMAKSFPATTLSVWSDAYADKELGFHLLLTGVRSVQALLGMDIEPPFNAAVLFFDLLVLLAFAWACVDFRTPFPWLWPLLLVGATPFFTFRIMLLRPHALSIALTLAIFSLLLRLKGFRNLCLFSFLSGAVMAYSYSNPNFLLPLVCAIAFARWIAKSDGLSLPRLCCLPFLCALGVASAYLLHPQFPNTFSIWWTQAFGVAFDTLNARGAVVFKADELGAINRAQILASIPLFFAFLCAAAQAFRLWLSKRLDPELPAAVLFAALFLFAMLLIPRGVEYAAPFSILAFALASREFLKREGSSKKLFPILLCVCVAGLAIWTAVYLRSTLRDEARFKRLDGLALFLGNAGVPPGTVIANVNWSDFPSLFYTAPSYRYLCGLEPLFGFMKSKERMGALENFRTGVKLMPREELAELTGAPLAYVSIFNAPLAKAMHMRGYPVLYQDEQGWLFELLPPSRWLH